MKIALGGWSRSIKSHSLMTYELLDTLQYLICCEELDDPKGGGEPVMFIFQATGEGWFRTTKG